MDSGPIVVDISSDEEGESEFDISRLGDDSYDWIAKLFDAAGDGGGGGGGGVEESDEVVVVDEFSRPAVMTKRNQDSSCAARVVDDDDDDCLVLDGDPDKLVLVGGDRSGDGSDELVIVGGKGEIACRDFPHPRHLCANFPFGTTPHEKYCNSCHCYVCDSPAPCMFWGNGASNIHHCHSTDNDAAWKAQRQSFKQKKVVAAHLPKLPTTVPSITPQPCFQSPDQFRYPYPVSPSIQPFRLNPSLRPCSTISTATHYPPSQRPRQGAAPRCTPKVNQQLNNYRPPLTGAQHMQRERHTGGALVQSSVHSHQKFKRSGTSGPGLVSSSVNKSQHTMSNHNQMHKSAPQRPHYQSAAAVRPQNQPTTLQRSQDRSTLQRTQCPAVPSTEDSIRQWQDILAGVASELGVPESINQGTGEVQPYAVSAQPPAFGSQFVSLNNTTQNMGLYPHSSPATIAPDSLDFDRSWLEGATAQKFPEQVVREDTQLPATLQPSNPVVSCGNSVSGDIHLESILAAMQQETVADAGNEPGPPTMDPNMLMYDFEATWSGLAQV